MISVTTNTITLAQILLLSSKFAWSSVVVVMMLNVVTVVSSLCSVHNINSQPNWLDVNVRLNRISDLPDFQLLINKIVAYYCQTRDSISDHGTRFPLKMNICYAIFVFYKID